MVKALAYGTADKQTVSITTLSNNNYTRTRKIIDSHLNVDGN